MSVCPAEQRALVEQFTGELDDVDDVAGFLIRCAKPPAPAFDNPHRLGLWLTVGVMVGFTVGSLLLLA